MTILVWARMTEVERQVDKFRIYLDVRSTRLADALVVDVERKVRS
jgi:hypothetical protein